MERLDIRNIVKASLLVIVISIILVIGWIALDIASNMVDPSIRGILSTISSIYLYAMFPIFFLVYLWSGARAVRKYRIDAIGAGIVSAFSYFVAGTFNLVMTSLINLLVLKQYIDVQGIHSTESTLAASLVGDVTGTGGVGISFLCGAGIIFMGMLANFVIGSFGGLLTSPRGTR